MGRSGLIRIVSWLGLLALLAFSGLYFLWPSPTSKLAGRWVVPNKLDGHSVTSDMPLGGADVTLRSDGTADAIEICRWTDSFHTTGTETRHLMGRWTVSGDKLQFFVDRVTSDRNADLQTVQQPRRGNWSLSNNGNTLTILCDAGIEIDERARSKGSN
jgi:hypothetical protein